MYFFSLMNMCSLHIRTFLGISHIFQIIIAKENICISFNIIIVTETTLTLLASQDRMEQHSKAFKRDGVGGGAD